MHCFLYTQILSTIGFDVRPTLLFMQLDSIGKRMLFTLLDTSHDPQENEVVYDGL